MKRLTAVLASAMALTLLLAPTAGASFGLNEFDLTFSGPPAPGAEFLQADERGETVAQAGAHPYAMTTTVGLNTKTTGKGTFADEQAKDVEVAQIPGFIGNQTAMAQCATVDFLEKSDVYKGDGSNGNAAKCAESTVIGVARVSVSENHCCFIQYAPLYNLVPAPGSAARLGFRVASTPVTLSIGVAEESPYELIAHTRNITQQLEFFKADITLWGVPADPRHDALRGNCLASATGQSLDNCSAGINPVAFLTLPRACQGPLATGYEIDSWENPGPYLPSGRPDLSDPRWVTGSLLTHDESSPPQPQGMTECGKLAFNPSITAQPTARAATSPSGLDFSLDVEDEGLTSTEEGATAASDIRKAVVTLPEGFSTNPSLAEGLTTCSEAQLAAETPYSVPGEGPIYTPPGAGCPNASKIGTVEVETPLLDESVKGSLYIATPYENPFNSLLALYIVLKNPVLGIVVRQPLKVETNPVTGQITTVAEELPQLPFSHFKLHFREGTRSPLATPPACGTYQVKAELTPWSGAAPTTSTSAFQIISGPDNSPCPTGGLPPFHPGLIAGSINNAAGRFSPFNIRLFRSDSEQEITHFSIKLPPGIVGKLAGIPYCSNAQIAAATARTGPHGGAEELANPSCPAASEVGHTLVGAGVGPSLTYAPGKFYLAGPYHGSNLSIVAITAGVVGPFDIGTVVIRQALKIDPETAEVFIDSTGSDPIPHIIKGIPVHLRDIRAYVDRPNFVLNPTDCSRTSTASTLLGSGLDFGSEADDRPVTVSTPFQAADCAALSFKPKLSLSLKGGTKRGAHPAFTAKLKMNGIGEAGIARAEVTLPKSEFIANAHFNTICTRVQFKAGAGNGSQCPAGSIYGKARATTPILGEPLTGPVFLRSSEHQLPDLVVALHNSQVDFDLVGHVDSVKGKLRNTFEAAPDAPVSSFVLEMQGGKKGLFENSTNLCKGTHKALSSFTGQNGKVWNTQPVMGVKCPKGRGGQKGPGKHRRHARR